MCFAETATPIDETAHRERQKEERLAAIVDDAEVIICNLLDLKMDLDIAADRLARQLSPREMMACEALAVQAFVSRNALQQLVAMLRKPLQAVS